VAKPLGVAAPLVLPAASAALTEKPTALFFWLLDREHARERTRRGD